MADNGPGKGTRPHEDISMSPSDQDGSNDTIIVDKEADSMMSFDSLESGALVLLPLLRTISLFLIS
jgi:hypothetical protein